jgi:hypothetical protein
MEAKNEKLGPSHTRGRTIEELGRLWVDLFGRNVQQMEMPWHAGGPDGELSVQEMTALVEASARREHRRNVVDDGRNGLNGIINENL